MMLNENMLAKTASSLKIYLCLKGSCHIDVQFLWQILPTVLSFRKFHVVSVVTWYQHLDLLVGPDKP